MQHTNAAAATALYDAGPANDAGDAVMARWLQSAGLQHLASPTGGNDQRHLPSLLMQVLCFPLHSLSITCMPLVLRRQSTLRAGRKDDTFFFVLDAQKQNS